MAIEVILAGDNSSAIKELHDLEIIASVERGQVDARITTSQLTFVNEYAELIRTYIAQGATGQSNGIFEGLDIQMNENGVNVFDGYLDQLNDFEIVNPTTVKSRIKKHNSNNDFQDRANGLTFGFLQEIAFINNSHYINIPYVNEKEFNFVEFAFLAFTIFTIIRDLATIVKEIAKQIEKAIAHATGGATGAAAAVILTVILIAIDLAFAILMVALLIDLIIQLLNYLISPVKFHKGIRVTTLLERGCLFLGQLYNTSIPEIQDLVILPSKTGIGQDNQQTKLIQGLQIVQPGVGAPSTKDFSYFLGTLFTTLNNAFRAQFTIIGGTVEHHAQNSPFWVKNSSYVLPPNLYESIQYNAKNIYDP